MNFINPDEIINFVYKHCNSSDIVGIMLTGSYADQTNKHQSDIDIIVVSMTANRQMHENILEDNTMYQLIIFPYCKITYLIFNDYIITKGVYFSMFTKGIILLDNTQILQKIQKNLLGQRFPQNNEHDILRLRRHITNDIEYILGDESSNKLYSVLEIIQMTAQLIVGKHVSTGKYLDRSLMPYNNERCLLDNALKTYLSNYDCKLFTDSIQTILEPYGGYLEKYTTGYVFNVPHDKYMLVFIPTYSIKNNSTKEITQHILNISEPFFHCIVFYEGRNQMMEQGTYIFIYSETKPIKSIYEILNRVRNTKFNYFGKDDIHLSYPYQSSYYEGVFVGGKEMFETLVPQFSQLSTTLIKSYKRHKQINTEHYQLSISVKVLYYFVYFMFVIPTVGDLFLNDCLLLFMPEAVDVNGIYNLKQLQQIKEQVIQLHCEMYEANKENLHIVLQQECQVTLQIKATIKHICCSLYKYSTDYKVSRQILYTISEYALPISILSHLLSICQLAPHEKFSLFYYLFRLSNEHVI